MSIACEIREPRFKYIYGGCRVPTDRTKKNQALSRTLFDLSNDHLTTLFYDYYIILY
jgi:hypothetical protein